MTSDQSQPLRPGDPSPQITLPAVNREGTVSLHGYQGKSPVLVGLFRGLHCPFCRRQIAQLGTAQEKLRAAGVEAVAIVNTPVERARLYFRYRPTSIVLLADPEAAAHRAFGVPAIGFASGEPESGPSQWPHRVPMAEFLAVRINPTGEMPEATDPFEANRVLNQKDGFQPNEVDDQIVAAHGTQLAGHFLIDRDGIVRWAHVEARDRGEDLCTFPSEEDLLTAARGLPK